MLFRHGKIIAEGYWSPYKADVSHLMHSVSKTFTSTAVGFAVKEKRLTVDDKVISFFPDDLPAIVSPNLEKLTIKHLLTMTAGQNPAPVFHISDNNWVKSFLAVPITNEPGKVFTYSSYATYMLSAVIQKITGMTVYDYLKPRLFDPLGIEGAVWESDPRGINCGGWGLRIKSSDMMKLGRFYLEKGKWNNKKLLPESWIKEATSVHIYQVEDPTFEQEMYDEWTQGYGYQIWRSTHNAYRADGAWGQYILVMPDQDAVLVTTARAADMSKILSLFWEHLFPGITARLLKPDDAAGDALISKLASLQIKNPFRTEEDEYIRRDTVYTYTMEANSFHINNLSFSFDETGGCLLTMNVQGTSYSFDFGQDAWRRGETEKKGPYYLSARRNPEGMQPFSVAGFGSWTEKDELRLNLRYLTEAEYETYNCKFIDKTIEVTVFNSFQPEDPVTITGSL
jgi:CubicO group peptidase (beta-lactamase class C family)